MPVTRETRKVIPVSAGTKAIIVLAMHRSGSSALTRVLNLHGAQISNNLMPGEPGNNETGFWESSDIFSIHEEILASAGAAWDDISAFPDRWYGSDVAKIFRKKIVGILRQDFGCAPLFIVKDPRICRLVPFWVSVLKELNAQPNFIIVFRNPLEVAMSLKVRDELHPSKSLLLWLRHVLDAERDSRGYKRSFVSYDALMEDWRATAERISTDLRIGWPRASHQAAAEIEDFLSFKLRHTEVAREEFEARADVVSWVKEAYVAALEAVAGNGQQLSDIFDHIRAELETADLAYGPLIALGRLQLRERDAEIERLANELEALNKRLGWIDKRLDREVRARQEILDSTSWRMTAPARWTSARVRRAFGKRF